MTLVIANNPKASLEASSTQFPRVNITLFQAEEMAKTRPLEVPDVVGST